MGVQWWFTLVVQIAKKAEKHSYPVYLVTPQTKTPQKPWLQKSLSLQEWWKPSKTQTPSPRKWRVRRCNPWRQFASRSGVDPRRRKTLGLLVGVGLSLLKPQTTSENLEVHGCIGCLGRLCSRRLHDGHYHPTWRWHHNGILLQKVSITRNTMSCYNL